MEFLKAALIIFIAIILINGVPVFDKSVTSVISIAVCTIILIYIINYVMPVITYIKSFFTQEINLDFNLIIKCMGISLITQFVSDVAADNGNKALANQMIFAGKVAIVALALPLFSQVLEIIGRLII